MSIESEIFKKKRVVFERLEPFGFQLEKGIYTYQELLLAGDFCAYISIDRLGQVTGQVMDTDTDEEYLALRVERAVGTYVGQVREAYLTILNKIAQTCCEDLPFVSDQANRLAHHIRETSGDSYDSPFEKNDAVVYRLPDTQKWYALITRIPRRKLEVGSEEWSQEELETELDVLNLKVNTKNMTTLLSQKGIYPAYHMAKKSWVSLVLDESLPDKIIFDLVANSRLLVKGNPLKIETGPDFWVIPANLKYYDIIQEFDQHESIWWTQKAAIQKGDYVCIYITAPTRAILYLCYVLEVDRVNDGYRDDCDIKKLMLIRRLKVFSASDFDAPRLKELGLTTVRGPRRLPEALKNEMEKVLK